jgi:hypothetical protein
VTAWKRKERYMNPYVYLESGWGLETIPNDPMIRYQILGEFKRFFIVNTKTNEKNKFYFIGNGYYDHDRLRRFSKQKS